MTSHPAITAARALSGVLSAENEALEMMDITGATALLALKQRATDDLLAAQRTTPPPERSAWLAEGQRLAALAQENKRLLERAMMAQNRVMACIARAIPRAVSHFAGYGASGRAPLMAASPPITLSNSA